MSQMTCLNGKNYHSWSIEMEDLLYVKGLHGPIFGSKPDTKSDADWELEHRQVCGFIRSWVDKNVKNGILKETDAKKM